MKIEKISKELRQLMIYKQFQKWFSSKYMKTILLQIYIFRILKTTLPVDFILVVIIDVLLTG